VIAGSWQNEFQQEHGFVRAVDGTITTFDPDKSIGTRAVTINTKGAIAGYWRTRSHSHAFMRTSRGKLKQIHLLKAKYSEAHSISDKGEIVGVNELQSFVRNSLGQISYFSYPNSVNTQATAMNNAEAVTGYYQDRNYVVHGFVRTP
jgi:uncharacterized membrane protein